MEHANWPHLDVASVPLVPLAHLTPDEIPFELVLILAGFLAGIGTERLRRLRTRRR